MVRRGLSLALAAAALAVGCRMERDMPDADDAPDSMAVVRALSSGSVRDSLMDVMPGGEMVRGDSAATRRLLERKR